MTEVRDSISKRNAEFIPAAGVGCGGGEKKRLALSLSRMA